MALNKVIEMGRLTATPELKTTPSGLSVTSFNIAVDKPYNKDHEHPEANFFPCVAWKGNAEAITKFFEKGSRIIVEGFLQSRKYTPNGSDKERTIIEIVVERFNFVDKKASTENTSSSQSTSDDDNEFETPDDDSMPW